MAKVDGAPLALDTPGNSSSPSDAQGSCHIDESYKYIFLPMCYLFTLVLSLGLNSIILYRSLRRTKQWNSSLIYMFNLALTDFMYGLSLPFLIASYIKRDQWIFGDFMCRLVRFLFYFNLYCSIFFLTCISFHRYLGICHPMKTITMETKKTVRAVCVLVWAVVFALTSPIFRFAKTEFSKNVTSCWDDALDSDLLHYVPYGIFLHLVGFFVPFCIIAWCYSRVARTIFRTLHSPQFQSPTPALNKRRKSIKTIMTITLLFALCFLPFHITRTLFLALRASRVADCHTMSVVSICYKVTRPLASFNAWLNALLYFLTKDKWGQTCLKPCKPENESKSSGNIFKPFP
ncbi:P2Y purinoceptor 4-like [Ambystoma mexicanum]|uniref:P2Y purinoceptor 4-like n=1 Tax=Ambystoma mexicanum TaxID=8296 RepID=UPI0037E7C78C